MTMDYSQYDDKELVEFCRKGDNLAWQKLITDYKDIIYSVAIKTLRGWQMPDAEFEAQEVYAIVYMRLLKHIDEIENPGAWIYRTTINACNEIRRQRARQAACELFETVPDNTDLEREYEQKNLKAKILVALKSIGKKCYRLLDSIFYSKLSYDKIAAVLGIKKGSIGPTKERCLKKLKSKLKKLSVEANDLY